MADPRKRYTKMNARLYKVKKILEENTALRESDILLWWEYINQEAANSKDPAPTGHGWFLKMDSQEAVARAARQVRSDFPHLRGTSKVQKGRAEEETVNRTFFGKVLNIIKTTK